MTAPFRVCEYSLCVYFCPFVYVSARLLLLSGFTIVSAVNQYIAMLSQSFTDFFFQVGSEYNRKDKSLVIGPTIVGRFFHSASAETYNISNGNLKG